MDILDRRVMVCVGLSIALAISCGDGDDASSGPTFCGDGEIDRSAGEVCDDGNTVSNDGCSADCLSTEVCGNMIVDVDEACDDGEESATCNADCTLVECGDGIQNVTAGEVCDDRNVVDGDGCSANCLSDETCPNNVVDTITGEVCDTGGDSETCDSDCTAVECGDSHVNTVEEACDTGSTSRTCDGDCTLPECGDRFVNPFTDEECDTGGNSPSCDADCTTAQCRDDFHNPAASEECDDGNAINGDGCDINCRLE